MTLEVLAAGQQTGDNYRFYGPSENTRFFIRIGAVENEEFAYFGQDDDFTERYADKLEMLKTYDGDEQLEQTREMGFLDESRHPHYPDDVQVYLTKEGLNPELCWTRAFGVGDHFIMGVLLNEPNQNFGYHEGERIAFFVKETEDKHIICYTDMTPSRKLTAEDLADGTMLKNAISAFNNERKNHNFVELLETLRDSYVWIPCNAIIGDEDLEAIHAAIEETNGDLSALAGKTLCNVDDIRFVADILKNGEEFFFPAFSSAEEMGEYGEGFSKLEKHFLEAIEWAIDIEPSVKGIVVNAFTEPFVLDREIFDIVQKMKTRLG